MNSEQFSIMLDCLAEAWRQKDYEKAISFFADQIIYVDPLRYRFENRAALLAFFENDVGHDQYIKWHHILFNEALQLGAAEYTYKGTHLYHGVVMIHVAESGITQWREYQYIAPKETPS
jgi:hypothetical protein